MTLKKDILVWAKDFNREQYNRYWEDSNKILAKMQQIEGLPAALEALYEQQKDIGFVHSEVSEIRRYSVPDPNNFSRKYSIQYNAPRGNRHKGSGRAHQVRKDALVNDGCFLCKHNIRLQQQGIQIGLDLTLGNRKYIALCCPFPLMPNHMIVATSDHIPQDWSKKNDYNNNALSIIEVFDHLTRLIEQLPGYIGFWNGASASIPGHFHYQLVKRERDNELFALELANNIPLGTQGFPVMKDYPIAALLFSGSRDEVTNKASLWIDKFTKQFDGFESLSANFIATQSRESISDINLYCIPRSTSRLFSPTLAGMVGSLECFGEIVLTTESDLEKLNSGYWNYDTISSLLAAVEPPGVKDIILNVGSTI